MRKTKQLREQISNIGNPTSMTHTRPFITVLLFLFVSTFASTSAQAQQDTWVQIEALPTLNEAQSRARAYANAFDNIAGFRVASGWYAVAIGPFSAQDAATEIARLRRENLIPSDSYLADSRGFSQQFWPLGGTSLSNQPAEQEETLLTQEEPIGTLLTLPDETPREARASENALSRAEKMAIQEALQWEGFYNSAIDGAFGRGTRASMGEFQSAMNYEVTGVLTTAQRRALLEKFNAVFTSAGMAPYTDSKAGISIDLPLGLVEFDRYDAPFAHFRSKTDKNVSVSLISQKGDQATLFGLYEIMQTLEIVPLQGDRNRGEDSFTLEGSNADISSYTYAKLDAGTIKGFTLVWPAGDRGSMKRISSAIQGSLVALNGDALNDMAGDGDREQRIDLMAGLDIRQPSLSRSGFYLDQNGTVLTTSEMAQTCARLTLDGETEATLLMSDPALGIAILRPSDTLTPLGFARLAATAPRLQSEIAVAGYSFEGALDAPTVTFGKLADVRGLAGEESLQRLDLSALLGDAGGPVVNGNGAVIGMLRAPAQGARSLPENVSFAASSAAISDVLAANGITGQTADEQTPLDAIDLTQAASDMTVLVSCWND
jgi:S1-C subfamily serine protease/peptidoglycan hydrolase-like protein with peptidoglycan-binding domain